MKAWKPSCCLFCLVLHSIHASHESRLDGFIVAALPLAGWQKGFARSSGCRLVLMAPPARCQESKGFLQEQKRAASLYSPGSSWLKQKRKNRAHVRAWTRAPALLRVSVQPGYHFNHANGSWTRRTDQSLIIVESHDSTTETLRSPWIIRGLIQSTRFSAL